MTSRENPQLKLLAIFHHLCKKYAIVDDHVNQCNRHSCKVIHARSRMLLATSLISSPYSHLHSEKLDVSVIKITLREPGMMLV